MLDKIDKTPKPIEVPNFYATLRGLSPYLWPAERSDLRLRVVISFVLMVIGRLFIVGMPFTFKWATDALVAAQSSKSELQAWWSILPWTSFSLAMVLTLVYILSRIGMSGLVQWRDAIFAPVLMYAVRKLALETFEHLHRLSLRFHLERKTGGLTRILERGRKGIEEIVRLGLLQLIPTIIELALIIAALLYVFDWRYVVILLTMVVIYMVFTIRATQWRMGIREKMNESDSDANTKAIDSLLNYETVKYFNAEAREAARYDRSMARYEANSTKSYQSLAALNFGQATIFSLGLGLTMVLCVQGIEAGTHTVGDFVLINAMMIQLYIPLNFMGMVYREIKQASLDIGEMMNLIKREPEIRDRPGAMPLRVTQGRVRFENVHFAYVPERPILKGVSFDVPAGSTVAIVGPSGAGKSTISRLLFRFYEPQRGRIVIDDQDIASVTQNSLRSAIGMVPQDTVLFNDTIGYNLRYGRWEASEEATKDAAKQAQIEKFIASLPDGMQTTVGERGLKLSGGEKQRVAIARTLLKAPPILVLDEATSALDSFTEKDIQDALDNAARGRTTLVIAHRLSTIIGADEIIVLDKGIVAERGTHSSLLSAGGIYAALWNRQREVALAEETLKRAAAEEGERVKPPMGG